MKKFFPLASLIAILGVVIYCFFLRSPPQNTIDPPKKVTQPFVDLLPNGKPPQIVILSFDGSKNLTFWQETLDFQNTTQVHFTYFISGVYFLTDTNHNLYQAPHQKRGDSKIGFGGNNKEVEQRIQLVKSSLVAGSEIASHLNGHFSPAQYNQQDWHQELATFSAFIKPYIVSGFRAPSLATNKFLWPELKNFGYRYEAGFPGTTSDWPFQKDDLVHFIMPSIPLSGTRQTVLAMDYNFYFAQTQAQSILVENTPAWNKALKQVKDSLTDYFNLNYSGNRAPVVFAIHFSNWDDGLYWQAMQDFAIQVCEKPEVVCASYHDTLEFLNRYPQFLRS